MFGRARQIIVNRFPQSLKHKLSRVNPRSVLAILLIIALLSLGACEDNRSRKRRRTRRIIRRKRKTEQIQNPQALDLSYISHTKQSQSGDTFHELEGLPSPQMLEEIFSLVRVKDGDTIVVGSKSEQITVRLLGIDTPEKRDSRPVVRYFAEQATEVTKSLVEGKQLRLGVDPVNSRKDHLDNFGRLLAYVYTVEDSLHVNAEIIRQGYGFSFVKYPCMFTDYFSGLERDARYHKRGLWCD